MRSPRQLKPKSKLVVRVGLSPKSRSIGIGATRVCIAGIALAKSLTSATTILRSDATNPERHDTSHWPFLIENLKRHEILFDRSMISGVDAVISRSAALKKLLDLGLARKVSGAAVEMDLNRLIQVVGPTVILEDLARGSKRYSVSDAFGSRARAPLTRTDGSCLYDLASTADDFSAGVTHIVRGQDKFEASVRQEALAVALGGWPRRYLHVPLFITGGGLDGRSKLLGPELEGLGISPLAVTIYLARSLSVSISEGSLVPEEIISSFIPSKCSTRNTKIDAIVLQRIQRQIERSEDLRMRMLSGIYSHRWPKLPPLLCLLLRQLRTNSEQRLELERMFFGASGLHNWGQNASRLLGLDDDGIGAIRSALQDGRIGHDEIQQAFLGRPLRLNTLELLNVAATWSEKWI